MNFEVGYRFGEIQISISSQKLIDKLMVGLDVVLNSDVCNRRFDDAKELMDFISAIYEAEKEMKGEES